MAATLQSVRELLEQRFPDAMPIRHGTAETVALGVGVLDRLLPGGGLPRGRVSVWSPGGGATAVLRNACAAAVARGERAAWVDGAGTIAGAYWRAGPLLLRPHATLDALACAEELLRSGGLALVVLSGVAALDSLAVRLARAAREGGAALIALSRAVPVASLRIASRIAPESYRWRPGPAGEPAEPESVLVRVEVSGLGLSAHAEFPLPIVHHEVRVSLDRGQFDRRGARR